MTKHGHRPRSPRGKVAQVARELRLLIAPTLGDWNKVLQLGLLITVVSTAVTVVGLLVLSAAAGTWPIEMLREYVETYASPTSTH